MKNEIVRLGVILLLISAIAGCILAFTYQLTLEPIAVAKEKASSGPDVAAAVIPGANSIEPMADTELLSKIKESNKYFIDLRVCKDASGNELGYGIRTLSPVNGYGGAMEVFIGISNEGKIAGMKILAHKETPGLGSNVEKPKFQDQFIGKGTEENLEVKKQISAWSGATYSSKSLTSAVNNAMSIYNEYLKK